MDAAVEAMQLGSKGGASFVLNLMRMIAIQTDRRADAGDFSVAEKLAADLSRYAADLHGSEAKDSTLPVIGDTQKGRADMHIALRRGDAQTARRIASELLARMRTFEPRGEFDKVRKSTVSFLAGNAKGQAEFLLGDYVASERSLRASIMDSIPEPMKKLNSVRLWRDRVTQAAKS